MADQKIPGIYNYCDRWCERCAFTSRCAVFENELDAPTESLDMNNKAFWERLAENFSKARKMLEQAAAHYNIDLKEIAQQANDIDLKQKIIRQESREHPIGELSWQYSKLSMDWLKRQPGMLDKLEEMKSELTIGVESIQSGKEKIAMIKDSLAVINWYETFIHVKLIRALSGKMKATNDAFVEMDDSPFGSDSDGSAKVALIGIERSMQAWAKLFDLLPQYEDEFLTILGMLDKLKKMSMEEFPKAMSFHRPGFDD